MKSILQFKRGLIALLCLFFLAEATAQDSGKDQVGELVTTLYFATNGEASLAGETARDVSEEITAALRSEKSLQYKNYKVLGKDQQPVFRSYENWASPLRPSEEILLRFESQGKALEQSMRMDLELWLSREKMMKADRVLKIAKPLFIGGPDWRGGKLILGVELISLK